MLMPLQGDQVEVDVLIVGGGMVGLIMAAALGGAGMEVLVVDRAPPPRQTDPAFDGRASAIAHGSRLILEGIGVWPRVATEAQPILDIRVSDGDAPFFLHYDHRELGDAPLGHMVENRITRRALHDHVAELGTVQLRAPATVAGLDREGSRARARLDDGTRIAASVVLAAEGKRSPTRAAAGIRVTEWSYPQTGIVCTVAHGEPHRGIAHERFLPAGPFAILPITDAREPDAEAVAAPDLPWRHRSSLVWTERSVLAPRILELERAAFDEELRRRFGDFLGPVRSVGPRWSHPLSVLIAERYVDHRLALVGDAAHAIHPIAGQGLNLGLRDVAALSEVLVDAARIGLDIGDVGVLERYQRWRRFDTMALTMVTDGLNRLFSNDIAPVRLARDLGLAAVNRMPPLKRLLMRHAMGTLGDLPRLARGQPL